MTADMTQGEARDHDHELEVLEDDQTVPPRPEEQLADAPDDDAAPTPPDAERAE